MILRKEQSFLRQNLIFYLAGGLVVLALKYYYSQADCDSLLWILAPTTRWVEFLSGISFTYVLGTGYVNHSLRLLIAPSCSGVRFMLIVAAMLIFSFVHTVASRKKFPPSREILRIGRGLGWILFSMAVSWVLTVFVNGLRIIIAIFLPIYLERAGLMGGVLTAERLHTMIGVVVYFAALLAIYRIAAYVIRERSGEANFLEEFARKCAPPVFWYFFMTAGLPLLNRAYQNDAAGYMEYTLLITGCLTLILLPYCLILLHRMQKKHKICNK